MITKKISLLAGLVFLTVFQSAYAKDIRSDDMIKSDIAERIAKNETLKNTNIKINVKDRLAVLTGQVRLYEKNWLPLVLLGQPPMFLKLIMKLE